MLMTPEEFDAVTDCDELYKYELIHGVLIVNPPAAESERDPNQELGYQLLLYRDNHPQGSVLDVTLPEQYVYLAHGRRIADRVIWAGLGRTPIPETDVPTIVVEFVSRRSRDRRRDYEEKRREYLELGVAEYWIIDRFRRTMTVLRKPPAEPAEQVLAADAVYRTPLLPGFELPLARLMAQADRWTKRRKR